MVKIGRCTAHERHEHHVHMVAKQAGRLAKAFLTCVIWMVSSTGSSDRLRPVSTQIIPGVIRFHSAESTRNRLLTLSLQAALFSRAAHHFQAPKSPTCKKKNRIIRIPKIFSQHIQGLTGSCKCSLKSIHWNQSNPLKNQHLSRPWQLRPRFPGWPSQLFDQVVVHLEVNLSTTTYIWRRKKNSSNLHSAVITSGYIRLLGGRVNQSVARWCPPSYKLVYNPINHWYITYKP